MKNQACPTCGFPLIKIDYYGEVLVGCIDCNYWGCPGDKKLMMEMQEDDLESPKSEHEARASAALASECQGRRLDPLKEEAPAGGRQGLPRCLELLCSGDGTCDWGGPITRAVYRGRRIISNWIFLMGDKRNLSRGCLCSRSISNG